MAKSDKIRSALSPILSFLLAGYVKLVYKTSRKISEPHDYAGHMHAHHPFIGGMWHGQFLMGPRLTPQTFRTSIMVAKHGDGDILGHTIEHFGMKLIRGGGAGHRKRDRGGMRALRESLRTPREWHNTWHDGRCPARSGAKSRSRHHHHCTHFRAPYFTNCIRDKPLSCLQHLEPHDTQSTHFQNYHTSSEIRFTFHAMPRQKSSNAYASSWKKK